MIKRLTRKETLDEVVELITKRSGLLIKMAKQADGDDDAFAVALRARAWELEMVVADIERTLRKKR